MKFVKPNAPVVVQVEVLGGVQLPLNGWECGLVANTNANQLNTMDKLVKVGDLIKVRLQGDHNKRTSGMVLFGDGEPPAI